MRGKEKKPVEVPAIEQVRAERERLRYRRRYRQTLRSTVNVLIVVAALAVLAATVLTPVLQIYGSSMTPTLSEGDIVVSLKGAEFQQGDLIAFYLGNKILVKRCIAGPGQWVDIDPDGTVYVDGKQLDEPYVTEKSFGDCNIELPIRCRRRYFCMGDHRSTSADSRHSEVGCVAERSRSSEKIVWRVFPLFQIRWASIKGGERRQGTAHGKQHTYKPAAQEKTLAQRGHGAGGGGRVLHDVCADSACHYNGAADLLRHGGAPARG